jgi:uncharacterized glyoxalase superfamily protein PhnB
MPAHLIRSVPILPVRDARASIDYYRRLGFDLDWTHEFEEGLPVFAAVSRGDVTLFLSGHPGEGAPNTLVYVYVDDVDALYRELDKGGARVEAAPKLTPWGTKEMLVRDPDGHALRFGMEVTRLA